MPPSPLDVLKRSLRDEGLYSPPNGPSPASHDDATLLSVALPPPFSVTAKIIHTVAFSVLASLTPQRHTSNLLPPKPGDARIECSVYTPPLTRTSSNPQNASIHVGPVDATR